MSQNIADILDRAADLIEPEGAWTQMDWGNREDCFCMLGAVAYAAGIDPDSPWSGNPACEARVPLTEVIGVPIFELTEWNDTPGRTQAEVVAKLREAAAKAREAQA